MPQQRKKKEKFRNNGKEWAEGMNDVQWLDGLAKEKDRRDERRGRGNEGKEQGN